MEFESASDIREKREELREARAKVLQKAKAGYEHRERVKEKAKVRGEDTWMLDSISRRVEEEEQTHKNNIKKIKMAKKEKKKKSRKGKHGDSDGGGEGGGKRMKKSKDEESNEGNDQGQSEKKKKRKNQKISESSAEDEWVEKGSTSKVNNAVPKVSEVVSAALPVEGCPAATAPKRDDWMTSMEGFVPTVTRKELRDAISKDKAQCVEDKNLLDKPGQHEKELNPHWKGGGSGFAPPPSDNKSAVQPDTSGTKLKWYKASYARCVRTAKEEGKNLEDVAAERWGSLEKLQTLITDAERVLELNKTRTDSRDRPKRREIEGGDGERRGPQGGARRDRDREREMRSSDKSNERGRERRWSRNRDQEESTQRGRSRSRSCQDDDNRRDGYGGRNNQRNRGRERSGERQSMRDRSRDRESMRDRSKDREKEKYHRTKSQDMDRHGSRYRERQSFKRPVSSSESDSDNSSADLHRSSKSHRSSNVHSSHKRRSRSDSKSRRRRRYSSSSSSSSSTSSSSGSNKRKSRPQQQQQRSGFMRPPRDSSEEEERNTSHPVPSSSHSNAAQRRSAASATVPSWKKAGKASEKKMGPVAPEISNRSSNRLEVPDDSGSGTSATRSPRVRKASMSNNSESSDSSDSSSEEEEKPPAASPPPAMTEQEMNTMAAKILRAEMMGDDELAETLKARLETARSGSNLTFEARAPAKKAKQDAEESDKAGETKIVVLSKVDNHGNVRPANASDIARESERYGGRKSQGSKRQKGRGEVATHGKKGERERYFHDDDKYDLKALVNRERFTTAEDQNAVFSKLAGKGAEKTDEEFQMDDLFEKGVSKVGSLADGQLGSTAAESRRLDAVLEGCPFCLDNTTKHTIVALASKTYLSLPSTESLASGHCFIVPMEHCISAQTVDEEVWQEVQTFRSALTTMFAAEGKDCVFMDVCMRLRWQPHWVVECVPLPRDVGDMASIYFKKAIQEYGSEWSQNKKLVTLKAKAGARRAIPRGFPYFSVEFAMEGGFGHVIEDEATFPAYFGKEIVGGMLDVEPKLWRRPAKQRFDDVRKKVLEFAALWKPHDFTVTSKTSLDERMSD